MKNKDKYDLRELRIIINRSRNINYCSLRIIHKRKKIFERIGISDYEIFNEISGWLEQDCSSLDEKEKEYLSAIIRPWRDKVECIRKQRFLAEENYEFIRIVYRDVIDFNHADFPNFPKGTMYQGMELGKEYSLEDLGI